MNIVWEDDDILVLNKPSGLVVNRAETSRSETLQQELGEYFKLGSSLGIGDRAGIVHRLDRETSGLLLVAKTQKAFSSLQEQFKRREVKKEYVALVHGKIGEQRVTIEGAIGRIGGFGRFGIHEEGRESRTDVEVVETYKIKDDYFSSIEFETKNRERYLKNNAMEYTLVRAFPKTGRTHQIRVHLKSINHPLVSDLIYAPVRLLKFDLTWCPRLFLHAKAIEFMHPTTKKIVYFEPALPKELTDVLQKYLQITPQN